MKTSEETTGFMVVLGRLSENIPASHQRGNAIQKIQIQEKEGK